MSAGDLWRSRPMGATEQSWCRAIPGGTGIVVLGLLLSKPPDHLILKTTIQNLQNSHPILRSRLRLNRSTPLSFSFAVPQQSPAVEVNSFDLESTIDILRRCDSGLPAFQCILEHEININPWENESEMSSTDGVGVFHAKTYEIEGQRWVVALKLHTAACDRAAAVVVLKELLGLMKEGGGTKMKIKGSVEVKMGIEDYIPRGKGSKPFWARGVDMLGYSLNSFRLAHIDFVDPDSPRRSQLVRFQLDPQQTTNLLEGCKKRGIKLCGAVTGAALMAARLCKHVPEGQWEKFAVVTLIDCRPILEPALTSHDIGFYHSAILSTHDMNGAERLWELSKKTYKTFQEAKSANKHFTDMTDLNSLMCGAIENPGLTPSSSLRTSFISVFEDVVVDKTDEEFKKMGVEDCMGCSSVHGVGPTLALFDTIRDGSLDCTCVYPAPLHSREQMQQLVQHMKRILVDCSS